jgi:gas vesicle protein
MRPLVSFLLGLIIGAVVILFLPDIRRENLNTELKSQIQVLQKQIQELGGELKGIKLPTPSSAPSPTPTPTPR